MATDYDAAARRERYLRERELKGRPKGSQSPPRPPQRSSRSTTSSRTSSFTDSSDAAKARVSRLKGKIASLEGALTKALAALSEKRRNASQAEKESSDGKTTVEERLASKKSRDKASAETSAKSKEPWSKKGKKGGGSSKASASRDASIMSIDELESRVSSIRSAISSAKSQLASAMGQLSHSDPLAFELRLNAPTSRKESVHMTADFGGYATRHDVPCADGRTIKPGAFQENDGMIVPLVWQHGHNNVDNVLGHCKLEYRNDGVYAHAYFNETASGQNAKKQVQHGDLRFLSIFANQLQEKAKAGVAHIKDVVKGNIREVSLVLAGANPGAYIDNVAVVHGDGEMDFDVSEAIITTGLEVELSHADTATATDTEENEETLQDILDTLDEKQTTAVNFLLSQALTHDDVMHSDTEEVAATDSDDANQDSEVNSEADTEANADVDADADSNVDASVDTPTNPNNEAGDDVQHDNSQEDNSMTHNVFDQAKQSQGARPKASLSHSDVQSIVARAQKIGSLKEAVEEHVSTTGVMVDGTLQHGIENIDYLFPDAQLLENSPAFISRRMEWVDKVLSSVRKSPFSRIKTISADITPDEARARGYIKGNMKNEEFFALSKRETTPQTVYKKQKLDRDDVVGWLKAEMRVMLDEEIAGAILVGDGRSIGDDDKIRETNIRPIASDAELYVTTVNVNLADASSSVEELVDRVISNRRYYKGTGQPTFFTTESTISSFLTVKDNFGRRLYQSLPEVAAVLRVAEIVPVEVMERVPDLVGIMVNLADYTLGADRGGQATMFDDFDIDYNKLRYLIETRLSGALTTPKSAIVFRTVAGSSVERTPTEPTFDGTTVTVPTVTGVTYKNARTNATLTTASPVVLADGETLNVVAVPNSGSHFANNQNDEWSYTNELG